MTLIIKKPRKLLKNPSKNLSKGLSKKLCKGLCLAVFMAILTSPSYANPLESIDSVSGSYGSSFSSNADLDNMRFSIQHNISDWSWQGEQWRMDVIIGSDIFFMQNQTNHTTSGGHDNLTGVAVTPLFRFQPQAALWDTVRPFVEAGVGISFLNHTTVATDKNKPVRLGTSFQFQDIIGVGARFGEGSKYELGLRGIHFSNFGISENNDGLNFIEMHVAYHF
jgi:hypothetical protein